MLEKDFIENNLNTLLVLFKDGKSIKEIAEVLDIPKSTLHNRLKLYWKKYPEKYVDFYPKKIISKEDLYRMHVIEKLSILQISKIKDIYYQTLLKYCKIYNIPRYDYRAKRGKSHFAWKGCGDIPGWFLNKTKSGAENRKIIFDVNEEELWQQWLFQDGKCALTGVKLNFSYTKNRQQTSASLDRIDSSKGYVKGNIQWVHKWINLMKLDFSQEEFISWCKLVVKNNE